MNPNDPDVSRALAKLQNFHDLEIPELLEMARGAKDFKDLRKRYADHFNFFLRQVPKLP